MEVLLTFFSVLLQIVILYIPLTGKKMYDHRRKFPNNYTKWFWSIVAFGIISGAITLYQYFLAKEAERVHDLSISAYQKSTDSIQHEYFEQTSQLIEIVTENTGTPWIVYSIDVENSLT